jgi:hypothetical protein
MPLEQQKHLADIHVHEGFKAIMIHATKAPIH